MWWPFKKHPPVVTDDLAEAKLMRDISTQQMLRVSNRGPAITQLSTYLAERRIQNHFGEAIQLSFTPRRNP